MVSILWALWCFPTDGSPSSALLVGPAVSSLIVQGISVKYFVYNWKVLLLRGPLKIQSPIKLTTLFLSFLEYIYPYGSYPGSFNALPSNRADTIIESQKGVNK